MIRLSGRLGVSSSDSLREALTAAVAADRGNDLVVDLTRVDYMSSGGLNVLESVAELLSGQGRKLILCGPGGPVRLVLRFCGPQPNFVVETSLATAIDHARQY